MSHSDQKKDLFGFNLSTSLLRFVLALLLALLSLSIMRLGFGWFNPTTVPAHGPWLRWLTGGLVFDLAACGYLLLPWVLAEGFGERSRVRDFFFYFLPIFTALIITGIDIGFFPFSSRRLTFQFFYTTDLENQGAGQILVYIRDFWRIAVLTFTCAGIPALFLRAKLRSSRRPRFPTLSRIGFLMIVLPLLLVMVRGKIRLSERPITVSAAAQYAEGAAVPLVLNSAFTVIRTFGKKSLSGRTYFSEAELQKIFSPKVRVTPLKRGTQIQNIVVLILESFSAEYSGHLSVRQDRGFTPFLDSLMQRSAWWPIGLANGTRSIQAPHSILSSIPTLMPDLYNLSQYNANTIDSVALQMKRSFGGESAFYHGASQGSMAFDSFASMAGFESYHGLNSHKEPLRSEDVSIWGIQDRAFLQFFAKDLGRLKTPFVATLFTLSSHHPYKIPAYEDLTRYPKGRHEIQQVVAYTDDSLREFFEIASQQEWYSNTLFLLTADHAGPRVNDSGGPRFTERSLYPEWLEKYRVPIVLFSPSGHVPIGMQGPIAEHIDLFPTLLSAAGFEGEIFSFGQNLLSTEVRPKVRFIDNENGFFRMLFQRPDRSFGKVEFDGESILSPDVRDSTSEAPEKLLKAMIQTYEAALIKNQMTLPTLSKLK